MFPFLSSFASAKWHMSLKSMAFEILLTYFSILGFKTHVSKVLLLLAFCIKAAESSGYQMQSHKSNQYSQHVSCENSACEPGGPGDDLGWVMTTESDARCFNEFCDWSAFASSIWDSECLHRCWWRLFRNASMLKSWLPLQVLWKCTRAITVKPRYKEHHINKHFR